MSKVKHNIKKWIFSFSIAGVVLLGNPLTAYAEAFLDIVFLVERVSGYILLQVEQHGESWYVHPDTHSRHYMPDGATAYELMRSFGLGITDVDLARIPSETNVDTLRTASSVCDVNQDANRLRGKILLQVEQHGEAWYVYPLNCRRIYMADGDTAYTIMRFLGLGITDSDLSGITVGETIAPEVTDDVVEEDKQLTVAERPYAEIEDAAFALVNAHRKQLGRAELPWSDVIADISRIHSENMAQGVVEPGHAGFSERVDVLGETFVARTSTSENVAWTNATNPASSAFNWWLSSPGHKSNLEHDVHTVTGVGVARSVDGIYYFTQMFIAE